MRNRLQPPILLAVLLFSANLLIAATCPVVRHPAPSDADRALLSADFTRAAMLYQTALTAHPGDPDLTAGLVHALLHQQKVDEAAEAVKAALAAAPNAPALISLRGEVELRQGLPWEAAKSATQAGQLDPCNPRNHLLLANLARISSLYAASRTQLNIAHQLDPADPQIRAEWIHTLSLRKRIEETEAYLSAPTGDDEDMARHWRMYLESLKKMEAQPLKPCHLISPTQNADIPFVRLMRDATHMRAFGLEVGLNGHNARLQIDTGAGGVLISRTVAERAGLKPFSETEMSGIGDKGFKPGYSAYADSIRIGALEFQNCQVRVLDSHNVLEDYDGLIGMDVFSSFLVTLDFPVRKLLLGPLPVRPGQIEAPKPALQTAEVEREDAAPSGDSSGKPDQAAPASQSPSAAPSPASPPAPNNAPHGPYDRYVAPEMKDYTPVYRVGHQLLMPTELNDNPPRLFILDTGAWSTIISPQAAREVGKLHSESGLHVNGISGDVNKVYTSDEVTFRFAHLSQKAREVVSIDTANMSKNIGMEISGFLGASTLDQVTMHIDYRDGLVKFDYNPNRGYKY